LVQIYVNVAVEMNQSADAGDAFVWTNEEGGTNEGVYLTECWACSARHGIILDGVEDAIVLGGEVHGNDMHGIWIQDTDTVSVKIDSVKVAVNSRTQTNTYDNIHVDANITKFSITDNVIYGSNIFGETGEPYARYGIRVDTGDSNWYVIADNLCVDHGTSGISDGGSGSDKSVVDNVEGP
jgi:hypothetical protein